MLDTWLEAWRNLSHGLLQAEWTMPALALVACLAAGGAAATLGGRYAELRVRRQLRSNTASDDVLAQFVASQAFAREEEGRAFRPQELIIRSLSIKARWVRPWHLHTIVVAVVFAATRLVGMQLHLTLLVSVIALVVSQRVLSSRWHQYRMRLERHLPLFLSQLSSSLATTSSFVAAMEMCTRAEGSREADHYFATLLENYKLDGASAIDGAIRQARHISHSLVTALYLLQRTAQSGGDSYRDSLHEAAQRMMELQEARVEVLVQGARARGVLVFLLVILTATIGAMVSFNPTFREAYQNPAVRIVGVVLSGVIVGGYFLMEYIVSQNLK